MAELTVNNVSISIEFVQTAIAKAALEPEPLEQILNACRIPTALLQEAHARVSLRQFASLISMLILHSGDELLGQAKQPLPVGSLSLLTHWLVSARDIGHAIDRFVHFYQILGKGLDVEAKRTHHDVRIVIKDGFHAPRANRFIAEFGLFHIHRMLCWLAQELFVIERIEFPFAKPRHWKDYRLMFYGADIRFGAADTCIVFDTHIEHRSILQTQESLKRLLVNPINELLILKFQEQTWVTKITQILQKRLHNLPTLAELADELNIPAYTLQRRLKDENISYLALKNQIKRDIAIELLVHGDKSIEDISQHLGFAETSPFTRRFKEWTGVPPSAYRKVSHQT